MGMVQEGRYGDGSGRALCGWFRKGVMGMVQEGRYVDGSGRALWGALWGWFRKGGMGMVQEGQINVLAKSMLIARAG